MHEFPIIIQRDKNRIPNRLPLNLQRGREVNPSSKLSANLQNLQYLLVNSNGKQLTYRNLRTSKNNNNLINKRSLNKTTRLIYYRSFRNIAIDQNLRKKITSNSIISVSRWNLKCRQNQSSRLLKGKKKRRHQFSLKSHKLHQ